MPTLFQIYAHPSDNFVATIIWQKIFSPKNSAKHISEDHDYILLYAKNKGKWDRNLLPRSASQDDRYSNPDDDPRGPWTSGDLSARNYYSEGTYPVTTPSGRIIPGPPKGTYWRVSKEKLLEFDEDGRIWWGEGGDNVPRLKRFLTEVQDGVVPQTLWTYHEVGHTQEAKKELIQICDFESSDDVFVTPKPTRLIRRILQIATDPDDLVLDSFAGTGTTGQAVLEQNAQDGGNRRFILVEIDANVARKVAHQRLQRVIEGYAYKGNERTELLREKLTFSNFKRADKILHQMEMLQSAHAQEYDGFERRIENEHVVLYGRKKTDGFREGLGGGFRYCELGATLFDSTGQIREGEVSFSDLARHIFLSQTGAPLPAGVNGNTPLLGIRDGTAVYLLYNGILGDVSRDGGNVLTPTILRSLPPHDGPRVVFGYDCTLDASQLLRQQITFRQIPYDVQT